MVSPPAVTDVLAVEPEPYLRGLAQAAAGQAPVPNPGGRRHRRRPVGS